MKISKAFTLAEVLITLAIIGVVAALSIPSVISNTQQQEFKTGLRKAVSVLNSAITVNKALDGESPYDNANLFGYLMRHMSILKSTDNTRDIYYVQASWLNAAFYTTDGIKFEFRRGGNKASNVRPLYENPSIYPCTAGMLGDRNPETMNGEVNCGGCGAFGVKKKI